MRRARVFAVVLIASWAAPARAQDAGVEEVRACARRNLPERTARQAVLFESKDAAGAGQRIEAEVLWRRNDDGRSQVRLAIEAPPDVRGTGFLLVERENGADMFSYLPEIGRVRRLTGRAISGSLFGTDFSYEDFERVQITAGGTSLERLPDADVDGRKAYVVAAAIPPDAGSAYERIVTYVDRETCVALRTDLEAKTGTAAKQMSAFFAEVRQVGTRWIPHVIRIDDKESGRSTTLTVRKVDLDVPLSPSEFSETALLKSR
jgi:hypothetical protein